MVWITSNANFFSRSTQVESSIVRVMITWIIHPLTILLYWFPMLVCLPALLVSSPAGINPWVLHYCAVIGGLTHPVICP